ncbi:Glycoside hydrolase, family 47 [Artemisia annua]|uniref:Glycoside hydrolase, family 47 n=1 Tax=Artemisia annua TaxID=35608 RepID=A0A2U1PT65_ARTAN|nr:Glycoside hydrolase, family 47 [Artemisia annua]
MSTTPPSSSPLLHLRHFRHRLHHSIIVVVHPKNTIRKLKSNKRYAKTVWRNQISVLQYYQIKKTTRHWKVHHLNNFYSNSNEKVGVVGPSTNSLCQPRRQPVKSELQDNVEGTLISSCLVPQKDHRNANHSMTFQEDGNTLGAGKMEKLLDKLVETMMSVITQTIFTKCMKRECMACSTRKFLALLMICVLTYLMVTYASPDHSIKNGMSGAKKVVPLLIKAIGWQGGSMLALETLKRVVVIGWQGGSMLALETLKRVVVSRNIEGDALVA